MKDMPFLIDSVTAELGRQGFKLHQMIHPVIEVERGGKGEILSLKPGGQPESVMHFEITHIEDKKLLKKLEHDMENVLEYARLAVADWKKMLAKLDETLKTFSEGEIHRPGKDLEETRDFLKWLGTNNFTFLGFIEYEFPRGKNGRIELKMLQDSELGIFRMKDSHFRPLGLSSLSEEALQQVRSPNLVEISKSSRKSVVHRPVQMDYVGVKVFDAKGEVRAERLFIGLFTSGVYYQSATLIPIIRRKIEVTLKASGFKGNSHNGKALMTILETYPRDELLQISDDELFETAMAIVELQKRPRVRLFARTDSFGRFISCIIFVPREGFTPRTRERIQATLEKELGGTVSDLHTQLTTDSPLVRLHIIIKRAVGQEGSEKVPGKPKKFNADAIEAKLTEVVTSWLDGLLGGLVKRLGERAGEELSYKYAERFPEAFMARYHFGGTVRDIMKMEEALQNNRTAIDLYQLIEDREENYQLKIYHPKTQITLSEILPLLENMGFHVIDETSFLISPRTAADGVWLHHFALKDSRPEKSIRAVDFALIKTEFEDALLRVYSRKMEDDAFNKLMLRSGMKRRDVEMLRALSKYLAQTSFTYSHAFMAERLARNPDIAALLAV